MLALSNQVEPRIQRLGLPKWQWHVRSELHQTSTLLHGTYLNETKVYKLLAKYECMERLSLLEMAVWKTVCILGKEAEDDESDQGETTTQQPMRGWQVYKTPTTRHNSAIHVIVGGVMPFLDDL